MLAVLDSTGYKILLLVHLLAVVVAFGANFVAPMLARTGVGGEGFAKAAKFIQLPSLGFVFVAGMGLVGMSDEVYSFSEAWVSIGFAVAILAAIVVFLLAQAHTKGEAAHISMYTGVLHLLLLVGMYAMIFKPGH